MNIKTIVLAAVVTGLSILAHAQSGTIGFADLGTTTVGGGNIGTATVFNIGELFNTFSSTGDFVGFAAPQIFGSVSLDVTSPTSLSFGTGIFGYFNSSSISVVSQSSSTVEIYALGNYIAGSYFSLSGLEPASFDLTFNQDPSGSGPISASGVFSTPPAPVPEPATMTLVALGGAGLLLFRRRK